MNTRAKTRLQILYELRPIVTVHLAVLDHVFRLPRRHKTKGSAYHDTRAPAVDTHNNESQALFKHINHLNEQAS